MVKEHQIQMEENHTGFYGENSIMKNQFQGIALILIAGVFVVFIGSSETYSSQESTSNEMLVSQSVVDKGVFGEKSANYIAFGFNENILLPDNTHVPAPSTISLFIGKEYDQIGFIYEYGLDLTNEDVTTDMPKDQYGNTYLYYGKLKHLKNDIYSVSGDVIPSWDVLKGYVKEGVDFYVVLNDDKFYLVFEDLSVEKLKSYTSFKYYIFDNY